MCVQQLPRDRSNLFNVRLIALHAKLKLVPRHNPYVAELHRHSMLLQLDGAGGRRV